MTTQNDIIGELRKELQKEYDRWKICSKSEALFSYQQGGASAALYALELLNKLSPPDIDKCEQEVGGEAEKTIQESFAEDFPNTWGKPEKEEKENQSPTPEGSELPEFCTKFSIEDAFKEASEQSLEDVERIVLRSIGQQVERISEYLSSPHQLHTPERPN